MSADIEDELLAEVALLRGVIAGVEEMLACDYDADTKVIYAQQILAASDSPPRPAQERV